MPLNGAALADISFLLLIFFLLTATMDTELGLPRQLPRPAPEEDVEMEIERRNMFIINVNRFDQIQVRNMLRDEIYENAEELLGTSTKMSLRDKVREFVLNENRLETLPIVTYEDFEDPIGTQPFTAQHVISMQNDATASYRVFIAVQNELVRAYNELRQEAARRFFNMNYDDLSAAQTTQINRLVPMRISEAEPRDFSAGGR